MSIGLLHKGAMYQSSIMRTFSLKCTSVTSCEDFIGALFLIPCTMDGKKLVVEWSMLGQRFIYSIPINYLGVPILLPSLFNPILLE